MTSVSFIPYPLGASPLPGLLLASDGNYYGVNYVGGSANDGTVFKLTPGGTLTVLVSFSGLNGANPASALIEGKDGNFYGTTAYGGSSNQGTVFKLTRDGTLTSLASFSYSNAAQPLSPSALIQASDGNFYGTTTYGGLSNDGTVFKVTPAGSLTTLVNFDGTNGLYPTAELIQGSDGNLYGTTSGSGSSVGSMTNGTVFEMSTSGALLTLVNFNGTDGATPQAGLLETSDGSLYGTTKAGGSANLGTIFKITSGVLTTLVNFNTTNGANPAAGLVRDSNGNFFGSTYFGGSSSDGTIFELAGNGTLSTLVNFNNTNGSYPTGRLVPDGTGNFYGTTRSGGGSNGSGTVFSTTASGALTTLATFSPTIIGYPTSIVKASDGNYYGTTSSGSQSNTIFKMTPGGTLSTLVSLASNLSYPNAELIPDASGNLYGTTNDGDGSDGNGKIFRVTTSGSVSILASFSNTNGAVPAADMVLGNDGNLYGTTKYGGASGDGTAFEYNLSNATLTELASFTQTTFGGAPAIVEGPLVQNTNGNFYGTTNVRNGSVFKMTTGGSVTTLFAFSGANGSNPGGLIAGGDGNYYFPGTGPSNGYTSVSLYKLTPSGAVALLGTASDSGGYSAAFAPLTLGSDGNFYGTTQYGGNPSTNYGTLFEATSTGIITNLVSFNGTNGKNPASAMVQGPNGTLYGVAGGGSANAGVVYCLNPAPVNQVTFASASTIPIITSSLAINGSALSLALNYAPSPGDVLTVVQTTGGSPINGTFTNLPNGGTINASYGGTTFTFTANYSGGSGDNLTLTLVASPSTDTPLLPNWAYFVLMASLVLTACQNLRSRGQIEPN